MRRSPELPSTLEILNSSSAQDKDSVTVTQATATKYNLTSISDLNPVAKNLIFGGPPEFKTRTDGLVGLKKTYGLTFKGFDPLDESGPLTLAALVDGKVQAADVFTTTPQIITDHLVALADPKFNFAAQNVTPLVYKKAITPTITATLNEISAKLTTAALLPWTRRSSWITPTTRRSRPGWLKAKGLRADRAAGGRRHEDLPRLSRAAGAGRGPLGDRARLWRAAAGPARPCAAPCAAGDDDGHAYRGARRRGRSAVRG